MDRIQYILARDGGFIVMSKAGNFAYAYPTSPNAYRAARNAAGKDRLHIATMMATNADLDAAWCPVHIVDAHNAHLRATFAAERATVNATAISDE